MSVGRRERRAYINPCLVVATALGAAAASVGTTNTAVLRWSPVPAPSTADIVVADSATLGMTFTLNQPGCYEIEMMLLQVASTTLLAGFSINAAVAPLVANPAMLVDGVFAVAGPSVLPAATGFGLFLKSTLRIDPASVGAVLRTHATNGAGASPEPSMTEASCWLRITRTMDMG